MWMDTNSDPHECSGFHECPLLVGHERRVLAAPRRSTDRVADVRLPAEWIADEIGADLVVIGRRGLNRVKRILLGSTSEQVAGNASWVLIVQAAPAAR